jgi:hypothetical protein
VALRLSHERISCWLLLDDLKPFSGNEIGGVGGASVEQVLLTALWSDGRLELRLGMEIFRAGSLSRGQAGRSKNCFAMVLRTLQHLKCGVRRRLKLDSR